jgi:hypothetical protein
MMRDQSVDHFELSSGKNKIYVNQGLQTLCERDNCNFVLCGTHNCDALEGKLYLTVLLLYIIVLSKLS